MSSSSDERPMLSESNFRGLRGETKITLAWLTVGFALLLCGIVSVFWFSDITVSSSAQAIRKTDPVTRATQTTERTPSTLVDISTTSGPQCLGVPDLKKLDCYPEGGASEEKCRFRRCCYHDGQNQNDGTLGVPQCYYPSDYVGYKVSYLDCGNDRIKAKLQRVKASGFADDVGLLELGLSFIDGNSFRIKITDPSNERYEAPLYKDIEYKKTDGKERLYDVNLSPDGILSITRKSSGVKVFTTDLSYLVYSNQFLQLSAELPSRYLYGLGEHYAPLLKDFNWTRLTFFNKDNFPGPGLNIYGSHPFYLLLENSKESHGVLLLNSNSMDVILQPNPSIIYRTIGGIFDFFFFFGPTPSDVIQQYTNLVGYPFFPPYWSFGFHLCKYGYYSVEETRKVYLRTKQAGVPFDVQWNDIDYMDRNNDFTYDKVKFKELPQFVKELHDAKMHYMVMFDPGVSNTETPGTYPPYDEGVEDDVFVKNNTGEIFIGKVWNPISTVFPDFTHPNATSYWTRQFKYFHDAIPFDGAWIDMNEISNFYYNGTVNGCPESSIEDPPYLPGGRVPLRTQTLCMTAKHYRTLHYNEHNVYGLREGVATNYAMQNITGKRPFIISRATFPGQGHFTGHWSGDIASTWEDMRYSVRNMINFNLYGIPMVGSDICGFRQSTTRELCARWFALGAFYPFARNHNDIKNVEQDPAAMGKDVLSSAKNNLMIRYSLLPYLYYLFYRSHVYGEPVVRPLFFEFMNDPVTYSIEEQFLWGPSLLIIPALYEGISDVVAYFPQDTWYDFYTGEKRIHTDNKVTLSTPIDKINLAIRGGSILVLQHPSTTTTESRLNDFMLYISLGENASASGELYWDDGESIGSYKNQEYDLIRFNFLNQTLQSEIIHAGYNTSMTLDIIKVFGLDETPDHVKANGENTTILWDEKYKSLDIQVKSLSLLEPLTVVLHANTSSEK